MSSKVESKSEQDDYKIIQQVLRGRKEAYSELVERYKKQVFNVAYRMTNDAEVAMDISQEAFVKIYKNLEQYNPQYKFSSWLLKSVNNLCVDFFRTRSDQTASLDSIVDSGAERLLSTSNAVPSSAEEFEKNETRLELRLLLKEAISQLPLDYKSVVVLRHLQNLSYKEISQILNLPMGTIKARIFRARKMLKTHLERRISEV
ncbi:sigma-70 family RNA polymerase sigma factor [bacterium]|jgi:RNA polymerase sigma-70 factor, ECF subfamily|nr:sigma-70 family RNA polymerase sigma factor [bacterium]